VVRARWFAGAVFALGLAFAIARVGLATFPSAGKLGARWVMTDFQSSTYYPVRALLEGENPHDRERFQELYPVGESAYGPFLPVNLIVHLPFGLLDPALAAFVYFIVQILLTLALALVALRLAGGDTSVRSVALVAGLLLLSRPGHWTLLLGQPSLLLTVFCYCALLLARGAPVWSGLALSMAAYKPTFGLPLALLMLAAGHWREVGIGALFGVALNLPPLALLAANAGGAVAFVERLLAGYAGWQQHPQANISTSPWLVDAPSLVSRLMDHPLGAAPQVALALGIVVVAALAVRRIDWARLAERNIGVGIICTGMLAAVHHLGYDMVLLTAPAVALALGLLPPELPGWLRRSLAILYVVPAVNWVATLGVLEALQPSRGVWVLLTSVNAGCVLLLLLGHVGIAFAYCGRPSTLASMEPRTV
jgi:hypothetical protein